MSRPVPRVEAAGGLLVDEAGRLAVVHRPHRADWTLPKGKLEPGESHLDAARREVGEETGLSAEVLAEGPTARYADHRGRPKRVRYYAMRVLGGTFTPNDEVDELMWMLPADALAQLTYETDRVVVRSWSGTG